MFEIFIRVPRWNCQVQYNSLGNNGCFMQKMRKYYVIYLQLPLCSQSWVGRYEPSRIVTTGLVSLKYYWKGSTCSILIFTFASYVALSWPFSILFNIVISPYLRLFGLINIALRDVEAEFMYPFVLFRRPCHHYTSTVILHHVAATVTHLAISVVIIICRLRKSSGYRLILPQQEMKSHSWRIMGVEETTRARGKCKWFKKRKKEGILNAFKHEGFANIER